MTDRLAAQFAFLEEADRLKSVLRANVLLDGSRPENVGEHSWHLALWALVMAGSQPGVDLARVVAMLVLHDLPEIDTGDQPIHLDHDAPALARAEAQAARRIFGLLPPDIGAPLLALWQEFEAADTAEARLAKQLDHAQPIFQVLMSPTPLADHLAVVRDNLASGRAARFRDEWPEAYALAQDLLAGRPGTAPGELRARLSFLAEADRLKSVLRATTLCDGSRRENSGEHSWHLALYAMILADQAPGTVRIDRVIRMLVLHDLVEIDTGDVPIHSAGGTAHASAETLAAEARAADRIFGLLPAAQTREFRALWDEFEAAESPDAVFAKSLDRVQPVMQNLACGGGTWTSYGVSFDQLESRVGVKIARGAPGIWQWVRARALPWFENRGLGPAPSLPPAPGPG
ncbi:HD domain-containing protein [Pseudogemmobacter sonorensis]|uniref:HD domain-containing protein n=1 Tax=Pseudogemmobacter sonorensis TaxID=2989681 RepID=UPI0036AA9BCA